jgi:hypothetical protein
MEQYNLCGLSSLSGCGLRSIADQQHPAPLEIKGSALMHKVVFAAALAVGLITAPMSQFVSSAAAQQANAERNAKMKKEPSAGQLATRERQKKCGAEWKEAKASNKIEKERRGQNSGALATSVSSPPPTDIASTRAHKSLRIKRLRASARLKSRRRPLCHPNRGAAGNRIVLITP